MEAITDRSTGPNRTNRHRAQHHVTRNSLKLVDRLGGHPDRLAKLADVIDLTHEGEPDGFTVLVEATERLVAARRLAEASEIAIAAVQVRDAPPVPAARLRLTLSSILFMSGHAAEARTEADAVLATPNLPNELYVRAVLNRMLGLMTEDEWGLARRSAESILGGSIRPGMDAAIGGALTTLGVVTWNQGRINQAIDLVRAAVHRVDIGPSEARRTYPRLTLAAMLTAVGDFDEARVAIEDCRLEIERLGDGVWAAAPDVMLARLHFAEGHLEKALSHAQTALMVMEQLGTKLLAPSASVTLASACLARGHPDRAARHIEDLDNNPPVADEGAFGTATVGWVAGRLMARKAGAAPAVKLLSDVYDQLPTHPRLLIDEPAAAAWLVRTALATGDQPRAQLVVDCAERLAVNNDGVPTVAASALHARGLLDQNATILMQAAITHRHPWAAATAFEDAGMVMFEGDHPDNARALLEDALVRYRELTASHDVARVRGLLENSGAWRRRGRRAGRPVSGWESLTPIEREVARLVAEGLTNREAAERLYLSRHTVDFHLRSIYRKLAITSRVELTRLVLERGDSR
jgi:DNA-binding CsgD family transcriptional regulator